MIPIRSASASASSRYCVVRKTRDALAAREAVDLLPERGSALDVETGGRLVEEENARAVDERHREVEPALHAARVAADPAVGRLREADPREQLVRARQALGAGQRLERRLEPQVLAAGEERVERRLLERRPDLRSTFEPFRGDVEARDARRALGRRQERRQHVDGRRLPGPVRPEEPVDLAGRDGEVDPVDGPRPLLVLHDEAMGLDRGVPAHGPEPSDGQRCCARGARGRVASQRIRGRL